MSIVRLNKLTLFGRVEDKQALIKALQAFGRLHIIQQRVLGNDDLKGLKLSEALNKSIRYLESSGARSTQRSPAAGTDLGELIKAVQHNANQRRLLGDKLEKVQQREADLSPWGNFEFPPLLEIGDQRFWFYILPLKYKKHLQEIEYPWSIVHSDHRQMWVVVLAENEPATNLLPVERIHTGKEPLEAVRAQVRDLELQLEDLEFERLKLTRHLHFLKRMRARAKDQTHFHETVNACQESDSIFYLQAWLAADQRQALEPILKEYTAAAYFEDANEEDDVPSLLRNPETFAGGEQLVHFYQTPSYRSWDPSIVLFTSFSLFFAMILADAAYAAILSSALIITWPLLTRSKILRNLRPLLVSLCLCSLVWGVMVGSYFGLAPPEGSFLSVLQILSIQNFDQMMKISILFGLLHIGLANLQQAWLWRHSLRVLNHIGWLLVLSGGAVVTLEQGLNALSKGLFISGLLAVFIGAGTGESRGIKGLLLRLLQGLKSLSNISNAFGDVLSYLRLFALGLASASLAMTFNDLAQSALQKSTGLGLLSAILILFIGHVLNIFLAVVSGVVHGLRLNFIEFNKWALDGEGRPFTAFKKEEYTR